MTPVTLKISSRSQKYTHLFSASQWSIHASLIIIHRLVHVAGWRQAFWSKFDILMSPVTLTLGSRSAKSNRSIASSQICNHGSFIRMHSSIHKIGCTHAFLVQIWYSNVFCDLENMVNVTKIQQLNCSIPIRYPCEFDKNPPIGSLNRAQTTGYTNANADANRSAPKAICPPPLMLGDIWSKGYELNLFNTC